MLIGELARRTNATKHAIRHYTELGLLTTTTRPAGRRFYADYSEQNIERIETIKFCRRIGFSLEEIALSLDDYFSGKMTVNQQVATLGERLTLIDAQIDELKAVKNQLHDKIRWLQQNAETPELITD